MKIHENNVHEVVLPNSQHQRWPAAAKFTGSRKHQFEG